MLWIYDTAFQVEAAAVFQSKVIINASARSGKLSLHAQENMVSDRSRKMWITACPYTWYEIFIRPMST